MAASVSVGNAIAETEVPAVPAPAAPMVAEPGAPAAPAVAEVAVAEVPEPAVSVAPIAAAPEVAPAAPMDAPAEPIADAVVDQQVTTASVDSNPAQVTSTSDGAAGADGASTAATDAQIAPIAPRNHVPNHPDPCEGAPSASYTSGGACKINVCHATGSETNPFVFISPNVNSVTHQHGHEGHSEDEIGVASAADCPDGTTDPCDGEDQDGAYSDGNNCVVDICHATGSSTNPFNLITVSVNGLNGHGDHVGDIIPAPAGGCPAGEEPDCPAPGYEDTNGRCVVDICHATGSTSNPYTSITVSINGLNGHGDHPGDIIPAPAIGCPTGDDACPGPLNPGNQPPGTTCIVDVCPGPLNPGNQPIGTVCITDACPDELNPGDQPFGFPCVGDACPGLLNPGNQAPGTVCIVDACPDQLNPGNQPIGTVCITDACPDQLNPGDQPFGTVCAVPVPTPPTPAATPTPILPPEPSVPVEEPTIVTPVVNVEEDEVIPVLGEQDQPDQAEPAAAAAPSGDLPFTGAQTFGLTLLGLLTFLAGAMLVRRRPHRAK